MISNCENCEWCYFLTCVVFNCKSVNTHFKNKLQTSTRQQRLVFLSAHKTPHRNNHTTWTRQPQNLNPATCFRRFASFKSFTNCTRVHFGSTPVSETQTRLTFLLTHSGISPRTAATFTRSVWLLAAPSEGESYTHHFHLGRGSLSPAFLTRPTDRSCILLWSVGSSTSHNTGRGCWTETTQHNAKNVLFQLLFIGAIVWPLPYSTGASGRTSRSLHNTVEVVGRRQQHDTKKRVVSIVFSPGAIERLLPSSTGVSGWMSRSSHNTVEVVGRKQQHNATNEVLFQLYFFSVRLYDTPLLRRCKWMDVATFAQHKLLDENNNTTQKMCCSNCIFFSLRFYDPPLFLGCKWMDVATFAQHKLLDENNNTTQKTCCFNCIFSRCDFTTLPSSLGVSGWTSWPSHNTGPSC